MSMTIISCATNCKLRNTLNSWGHRTCRTISTCNELNWRIIHGKRLFILSTYEAIIWSQAYFYFYKFPLLSSSVCFTDERKTLNWNWISCLLKVHQCPVENRRLIPSDKLVTKSTAFSSGTLWREAAPASASHTTLLHTDIHFRIRSNSFANSFASWLSSWWCIITHWSASLTTFLAADTNRIL